VESGSASLAYSDLTSTGRPGLVDYRVGALIYAVIVNSDTQITNLTTAQLQSIYSGQITNWSQVGGTDEPIQIISRSTGSEIQLLFETYVLKGEQQSVAGTALFNDSNDAVTQKVLDTSGAISYVPLASVPVNGAQAISINGVAPSASSVSTNAYSFWSMEHLYSKQAATGLALSFISFCSTDTAALDLANDGVVSIKDLLPAALNSHMPGPTI
jgi:phosphate transport system substrate-binding protein